MLVQKDDGTALDLLGATVPAKENTERAEHTALAAARLIERWRADGHPNLAALQASITDEVQDLERVIWEVILRRMPDYAEGVQLDALGRLVGQPRNGLSDAAYLVRIKVRVRINQSFGRPIDVIEVLQTLGLLGIYLTEYPVASFSIHLDSPTDSAVVDRELPGIIAQARAGGVTAIVSYPVDRVSFRGAFFGSASAFGLNDTRGWSSSYNGSIGGLFGRGARA
jgi:hypothetical protein